VKNGKKQDEIEYKVIELYQYKGKIVRVVDADTFDASLDLGFGISIEQRFRVNDYDAPETWRPRNEAENIHGKAATARAIELLMGKDLLFESTKVPGIYGRFGATIWLKDGSNYAQVMISEGFSKKEEY